MSEDPLATIQTLGDRFHGVSLDYRKSGTGWPAPWRARLVSNKNEREEYRLEGYGHTAKNAIEALRFVVNEADGAH